MKSRYISLRKNPAGSPENKKISYPGKGTRFVKHLFFTCLKIEYTLCNSYSVFLSRLRSRNETYVLLFRRRRRRRRRRGKLFCV